MTQPNLQAAAPARVPGFIEQWSRRAFVLAAGGVWLAVAAAAYWSLWFLLALVVVAPLTWLGIKDMRQTTQAIRRNFPLIGHFRYLLESLRPEIRQYFIESDQEENPFSREKRTVIYARAKNQLDTLPFGTTRDVYRPGYEWINHSLAALPAPSSSAASAYRIVIGEANCAQPYAASLLNVSAMSYGALSANAIRALNLGAQKGNFYHNTGEGGISPYHREGGDLCWQVGTGYFGCRTPDGKFSPENFAARASLPEVKLIEIKLSQGAKPGHGGILPAAKVTKEISEIRGVPMGQDVNSPPSHSAFSTPIQMMEFIAQLRELSGGKPIGFKLCVGNLKEFLALCKAMRATNVTPDFITIDGGEGGTGAAPLEFSNSVGMPLIEGLAFAHNALVGAKLRDRIKIVAAGKLTTGFHIVRLLALGADLCNAARPMMFALGCIQALKCNTNHCPVGVATQDPKLTHGLVVGDKSERVYHFHRKTVHAAFELLAAAGLNGPHEIRAYHIFRRVDATEVRSFMELYPQLDPGAFLANDAPQRLQDLWTLAKADKF